MQPPNSFTEGLWKLMKENEFQEPYNDLMGDILKKHRKEGGMDNLPGKGKPLSQEYLSGDTLQHFQRIAMEAGYKPHWLVLQDEIRDEVSLLTKYYEAGISIDMEQRLQDINHKIATHNRACPRPMQKGPVGVETIQQAAKRLK